MEDGGYSPESPFLCSIINNEIVLDDSEYGQANFRLLISFTTHPVDKERDWATMLLAQQEIDTPEVRVALIRAASDPHETVRAEALVGLAQRDRALALPLVLRELARDHISYTVSEAVELLADPALLAGLEGWNKPTGDDWADSIFRDAVAACQPSDSGRADVD
jgi:hypothetical protein